MGNTSKSKYASQWEEVRKKKKAEEEESTSAKNQNSSKTSSKYESQWAEIKKRNIADVLNSMLEDYNGSVSSAQDRFKNVNSYRGDTADYLSQVEGYRNNYTTKKSEIDSILKQYKGYYDDDFIKAVNSTYADLDSGYEGLYKNASEDHKYFSQFADENAYKGALDNQTYSKKYAESTYADLQKAKADIEAKLSKNKDDETLNRELYWLQNHDRDMQYVDTMSDEDLSNLQVEYEDNKKVLKAEKARLQQEIAEIQKKAGRASPESWNGYAERVARIQEIDEELAGNSPVLYYDDVGAVTVSDTIRDREHEVTFNNIANNESHQLAYDKALEAQVKIKTLDERYRELQNQAADYERAGAVPDSLLAEMNSIARTIENQKDVIENFNSLGYDFDELEHYNRTKESRANFLAEQQKDAEYATEHPVKATLKSIGTAPASIVELVGNLVDTAQYGYSNVYDDKHINQNATYTGTVGQNINDYVMDKTNSEILSWLASGAYSGVTSSAQSALTTGACTLMFGAAGAPIALGIMGTEAAASSYNSAIMNGSTNGEAILTATASGIAEALFEKVSLDKLLDIGKMYDVSSMSALLKSMIKNSGATFVQGGVEASEEFFTEITNKIADEIINGDHSDYNTAVAKYKKMGYSDADAKDIATQDAIKEVLEALYGGFIGGIGSGAGASLTQGTRATGVAIGNEIMSNNYYNQMGRNIVTNEGVQDLTDKAKGSRELRKLANKVAGVNATELTDEKGIKKYEKQVGKLYKGVTESQLKNLSKSNASETEVNSFKELVKAELESKGVQNVDKAAEVVVKSALNDGKLTREESIIYNSVNGRQVIHNVLRSEDLQVEEGSALEQAKGEINSTRDLAKFDVNKALKRDLLSKTEYDVSSDGTTTIEATGEEVESMVITSLEGEDITLDVKSGDNHHTVVAGELRLNQDYAVILEGLKNIKDKVGLDDSTANKILTLWEGYDGDSFAFYKAVESGLLYGQYNMREDFEKSAFAKNLPEDIRNRVFEMGREYKQKVTEEKSASNKKNAIADLESSITYAEGVSYDSLNESQKAQVDFAQVIAKTFGFNLEIFRSPKKNGKSIGENGSYNISTNTMRLDVDAGTLDGKSLILFTQAHELTHYIKKWSPESYKTFADLVVKKYGEKGVSVDNLVQKQIKNSIYSAKADKTGRHHVLSYEEAFDEVVANACEDFLADTNIQQTINEIAKIDQTLAQKIKDFLKNIIAKLEEAIKGLQGQSVEATLLRDLDAEDLQELKDLWLAALIDSRENVLQARQNDAKAGKNTTDEGDVKLMARYAKQGGDFSSALDSAEWSKYNYAMISGVDAGLRISDHSILVECEKGDFSYKLVVYDNKTEENRILAVYGIGKNLYNKDISNFDAKIIGEFITDLEEQRYDNKKVLKRILDYYSRNAGYVLGRYNSKSNRFNKYGRKVSENESSNGQKTNGRGVSQGVGKTQINSDIQFHDRDADVYSRINEMQLEVNKLRQSIADIESSDEFKEEQRKLSEAFSKDIDTAIELYTKWLEESEYGELKSKKDAMEKELEKLRSERDNELSSIALNEEATAIAKSGLSEADYFRKQAIKEFGYTPYFYDAGYITPNGKMLNFSGEKGKHFGSRGEDHRAIGIIYAETQGTDALNRFMKDGNIRIMAESPGLDISTLVEPTKEQYSTIRKFVSEYANREFFNVDLSDENGKVIGSLEYEGRINPTRVINDIKHYYATGEIREQSTIDRFLYSDRVAVNQSMTMDGAKQMIQRAFVLGNIYEWYEGEYKNGDEWLRGEGGYEVALNIENEYTLVEKYLNKIQGYIDGDIYVEAILEAYLDGTLVGKEKPKAKRMDVSKNYRVNDTRFYSPKRIENVKQLFEIAGQKLTSKNRAEVSSARAKILLFAHNKGASELLGLSQAELNKKLRSWSGYTNGAREISEKLNRGVADSNKWTGIENCSWLYKNEVTTEELESLVKSIDGAADDYEKMYIARTMLALDTHIDWSWLSFKFDTYANVNKNSIDKCNGYYLDKNKEIVVSHNKPNTVAHEMGHALDYQWGRDLGFAYSSLTDVSRTTERITDADTRQFFDNFKVFIDSLTDNSDIRSEYTQNHKEVFARFVARFIQWVDNTGGNRSYTTEVDYYNDKFTASNYIEFVKLLQEKAMLDAKRMSNDTLEDVKFQDRDSTGRELSPEQAEFFKDSKVRDAKGNLLTVYHGTNATFNVFKKGDIGYHFGNKTTARNRVGYGKSTKLMECYIDITNPIVINEDFGSWDADYRLAQYLFEEGIITYDEGISVLRTDNKQYKRSTDDANKRLRELLLSKGYDGIIYKNEFESKGRKDSYIVFNSSQAKLTDNLTPTENEDIRYSERVTDKETLDFLNEQIENGEYIKVYRSFQVIDGGLYAPMNAVDRDENGKNKKLGYRSEYGVWEKSTESPEIAQKYMDSHPDAPYAKFDLDGVDNKTNGVAYNPYLHASNLVLNDQFSAAYRRNLITVECYVPLSEASGSYKAQYAKDATGWVDWKAGGVAGRLLKIKPELTRRLFVSRYMLPVRQVPDAEVAEMYREYLDGTDIAVPWNVVTPSLRKELEKVGVGISYNDVKFGTKTISFNDAFPDEDIKYQDRDLNEATFNGKPFWSGSVSLIDGVIEEVHSIEEAEAVDFHHSLYFSQAQVEKMEAGENAFFFIDGGKVEGDWRESVPKNIIKKIEEQITFNTDIAYQDRQYQPTLEDLGIDFKEENEKLKADVDRLQEMLKLQGTVTHGKALATKAYEGVAKKLLHNFGMKRVTDANLLDSLVKRLDKFYYSIIESDELAWETVFNDAMEIAEWLEYQMPVEEFRADYADEILKNIRSIKISLDDAQMAEVAYTYGSYNAFRKSNFGTIKLANDGIKLDSQWSEWAKAYPWVFDAETNSADMPVRLVEIINDLRTVYRVSEEYDKTDKLRSMAMDIYDSYWQIPTVRTLADKHQQEVNLLKSKHKTEMDALKERKDTQLKHTKEYYQEMVKKVRADKDAKMEAYKERTQEQRKKNLEGRTKTATKNKIKRVVKQLESLYSNPTKEKNVKIEFQDMVKKALVMADAIFDSSNISSYDILSGDITTTLTEKEKQSIEKWREIQKAREGYQQRLDVLEASENVNPKTHEELLKMISECNKKLNNISRSLSDVVERQRSELNDHSVQDAIDSLVEAYRSLEDSTEGYAKAAYNEYVATRLETLKKSLKNTTAKTMTLTQLDELYQAYKMVLSSVRTANELFVKNKRLSVVDAGESVIREVQKVAKITENKIAKLEELRSFSWQELKPVYAFERIGSETFMDMYKEVLRGQGVVARDIAEAQAFFRKMSTTYGYDSWDFKEMKDFKLADGRIFTINLQEIMAIYAYSRREQAIEHITEGGFTFNNNEFYTDNRQKGLKGKVKRVRTTAEAYRINDDVLYKIINSLTKEQKKFTEEMEDYLTSMGEKGNEVTRVLYGIDVFKEKVYFPLVTSEDFKQQTEKPVGEVSLRNWSATKSTVPHADNPIILGNFIDVWTNHINKMSTYHGMVLPIENLNKVFNYTGYYHSDKSVSVKTILKGAYGQAVNDYIRTFIQDLNGGVKVQGSGNFVMKAINKFKKTAVAGSLSVVIQQPTAVVRALAMIDAKYFVHGGDGMKHNEAWAELKKYAPIAIIKEMGGFDVGGGKQVAEYITAKEYKGIKAKGKGLLTDSTYRDESLMWGASKADEFGWITIWSAVKKEIADTTTLKVGSEEFLQACGERFTEVVDYTQVYDSVLSRSGFMRNKGEISKMATSFMGEPTTSFNMLYNAILQAKRGNISGRKVTRIVGYTMASILFAAIAKSLIYALRDDDDDESYAEKYFQALTESLISDMHIHNMLPYVNDIVSIFSGWDVERTDMAILKDIKDAIDGLDSSSKSDWRKVEDLAGAIAAFGGFPVKNILRTGREFRNFFANILDENVADDGDVMGAIEETITGEKSASDVNEALEKGKTDKAKELIKELVDEKVEGGKTEKEAKASIKASVTGYWKTLYLQAYRDNDSAEMLRIRRLLQSTGLYDNVVETCSNWIKGMKDETEETKYKKW